MAAKYPIGIQTFENIIKGGMVYVDKTALVYKLANGEKNNFLSRPRRFGKSLLVSTLHAYFDGRKDLFKGLAIEKLENDWVKYPVIHLDMSRGKYYSIENLHSVLNNMLVGYEQQYGIAVVDRHGYGTRLGNIIQAAEKEAGKSVVILIDEYDAPMLDSISDEERQSLICDIMRDFFSPLKANDGIERFVFLTGITKFSQLSIFSELNNIRNISMDDGFSTICGITKQEVLDNFQEGITAIADKNDMTFDEAVEKLRVQYDGYRFSPHGENIYNPFSLLNAFLDRQFKSYWFGSGTPTFLVELMQKNNILIPDLENITATDDQFDAPTEQITDPVPVLYQSGYVTIKDYDYGVYTLSFPNNEVRIGFNTFTLNYLIPRYGRQRTAFGAQFGRAMRADDIDTAMEALQEFLAGFPYDVIGNKERDYQAILYTVFEVINFTIQTEARTPRGRIDLLVQTKTSIFVMELKLDKSPDEALAQIDDRSYTLPWKHDGRRVFKVGITFSTKERNVTAWKYSEEK